MTSDATMSGTTRAVQLSTQINMKDITTDTLPQETSPVTTVAPTTVDHMPVTTATGDFTTRGNALLTTDRKTTDNQENAVSTDTLLTTPSGEITTHSRGVTTQRLDLLSTQQVLSTDAQTTIVRRATTERTLTTDVTTSAQNQDMSTVDEMSTDRVHTTVMTTERELIADGTTAVDYSTADVRSTDEQTTAGDQITTDFHKTTMELTTAGNSISTAATSLNDITTSDQRSTPNYASRDQTHITTSTTTLQYPTSESSLSVSTVERIATSQRTIENVESTARDSQAASTFPQPHTAFTSNISSSADVTTPYNAGASNGSTSVTSDDPSQYTSPATIPLTGTETSQEMTSHLIDSPTTGNNHQVCTRTSFRLY